MSHDETFVDPRSDLPHEIVTEQVYADDRTGDEYRIVYGDAECVLLRYHTDGGARHRLENRQQFENHVRAGRMVLTEPGTDSPRLPDDFEPIRSLTKRLHGRYELQGTRTGNHKAEAMEEFYDELNALAVDDVEPFDFESVPGIGAGAAENLRERGFVTEMDIARADKDTLMDVPLMGEANTENLLETINND